MQIFEDYVKQIAPGGPVPTGGSGGGAMNCTPLIQAVDAYRMALVADGYLRRYWGEIWDSNVFDLALPATREAKLFQVQLGSGGKTIQQTNFWGAGVMPDRNAMFVHSVSFCLVGIESNSAVVDIYDFSLINQKFITLKSIWKSGLCWRSCWNYIRITLISFRYSDV